MIKLDIIDSSKQDIFFTRDNKVCMNLNSYFSKPDLIKIREIDKSFISNLDTLNLCNLASLCYKFKINYSFLENIELVNKIVDLIRSYNPNIKLCQDEIINCMECDCKPFKNLFIFSNNQLLIHKCLRDNLKLLGFTDTQIPTVCGEYDNITDYIPRDLMDRIGLESDLTLMTYNYIKEVMND